ncbi:glycosyltransferase family A protein [Actinomadura sp. NEAU-AAG7]|uniref:glycosyltransferase family A protein n=1 Tax=Actinomadura sp. NEAU-AAG7 TaxID=2839640 RepID=UPI0027E08584|nr:glycosyltransferase family A protein [Actinomadura sp. NEAU-AAG7]
MDRTGAVDREEPVDISIVIPFKQRPRTLEIVLASLAEQTMERSRFEVVVGALEYSTGYVALCARFADRLTIRSVLSDEPWNVSRARNLAIRQASGRVIVTLDADVALPAATLENLYERYFAKEDEICVLGQSIGYSSRRSGGDELEPFDHYRKVLADLDPREAPPDPRRRVDPVVLPWTLVWSGFVALPAALVRAHGLLFDEGFRGWGIEDQEWGYRIQATGTPITMAPDVFGLHLPHPRDNAANTVSFDGNGTYFLSKWPSLDVESFRAFGMYEANERYLDLAESVRRCVPAGRVPGVVRGPSKGTDLLVIGAELDADGAVRDPAVTAMFDGPAEASPLVGLALPHPDGGVDGCVVLPPVARLGEPYRDAVLREARRVSRGPVTCV